jgi:6,7-dimethyl-8-ribityllumazine synthase
VRGACGSLEQVVHTAISVILPNKGSTDSPNSMSVFEGNLDGKDCSIGIVVSKFNEPVTSRLLAGAEEALNQLGTAAEQIQQVRVPGAFELPLAAKALAQSQQVDAVICLGAVIRGETPHFDYISRETSRGIGSVALETGIPVIFGVLTTNTVEQAMERSASSERNKGADAARTAIEMVSLLKQLHKANIRQPGFLR